MPFYSHVFNADVHALVLDCARIYVGGSFGYVGRRTGPVSAYSIATGRRLDLPGVGAGVVHTVLNDGAGGWFIGGSFAGAGSSGCRNLVHDSATLTLDRRWCPRPTGPVRSLARNGHRLFVGGTFGAIAGSARRNLAAIDTRTAAVASWGPRTGRWTNIWHLAVEGSSLFVVGDIDGLREDEAEYVRALDVQTGALLPWDANADYSDRLGSVYGTAAAGRRVYLWGGFSRLGGVRRDGLGAVDATSGRPLAWNPRPNGSVNSIVVAGRQIFVGGRFTRIAGAARSGLAAFDSATGALLPWRSPGIGVDVQSLAAASDAVVATAGRDYITGTPGELVAFDRRSGARLPRLRPALGSPVNALATNGRIVLIATGDVASIGGAVRGRAAALSRAGVLTSWSPRLTNSGINTYISGIGLVGDRVFVGGAFTHIGGTARRGVAALDAATGRVTPWRAQGRYGEVLTIATSPTAIYVLSLARDPFDDAEAFAVEPRTGARRAWRVTFADGYPIAAAAAGRRVYLAKDFEAEIWAVDARTGSRLHWAVALGDRVDAIAGLAATPSYVYATGQLDRSRWFLARVSAATRSWRFIATGPGRAGAVALEGGYAFVGGSFGIRRFAVN